MELAERARVHAALGDPARLRIVDALVLSDRTFQQLADAAGLRGNAAAHHLDVLEIAGLIERSVSEGDHRRRYVRLRRDTLEELGPPIPHQPQPGVVLFVCTHNSARSQFAAALWKARTGGNAQSAGTMPADLVHPRAVRAASSLGIDLTGAVPHGYDAITAEPDLVVSVCDRAREAGIPFEAPSLHWSVPDPVLVGTMGAFRSAFADVSKRVEGLAASLG